MILLSANIQNILASGKAESFYLLSIHEGDGSLYKTSTTHYSDILMANGITYAADDYIVALDPPQLSSTVDREQYKIVLTDPNFNTAASAQSNFIGKVLEVRLGFCDYDSHVPLTSMADTFVVYKGKIDAANSEIKTDIIGESLFNISGASPMLSLDSKKGINLSREDVRSRYPNDGCCDQIYEGSGTLVLKWGRA